MLFCYNQAQSGTQAGIDQKLRMDETSIGWWALQTAKQTNLYRTPCIHRRISKARRLCFSIQALLAEHRGMPDHAGGNDFGSIKREER